MNADKPSLEVPPQHGGPYSQIGVGYQDLSARDPRTSSSQSLVPSVPGSDDDESQTRRKLLVIYIHGFMGNETSFQSFPAHVHKYLKLALADTHVIHSKIYPKYKTYKSIDVARDNFSNWLQPHESPNTDVVLVGHSMGGLLAADVVLMKPIDQHDARFFFHRILGTVNLDAPLLGLHPGIIKSGIASLFRSKEKPKSPEGSSQMASGAPSPSPSPQSPVSSPSPQPFPMPGPFPAMTFDPNFNPAFTNDIRIKDRGWWKNIMHFTKKHHSEGIVDAATHHIMSHLEFGGCLMDFNGLELRYEDLRRLEDVDSFEHNGNPHVPPQVRFIQYFTVCHGYPKKHKKRDSGDKAANREAETDENAAPLTPRILMEAPMEDSQEQQGYFPPEAIPVEKPSPFDISDDDASLLSTEEKGSEIKAPAPEETRSGKSTEDLPDPETESSAHNSLTNRDAAAEDAAAVERRKSAHIDVENELASLVLDLPPIPDVPEKPTPPDLDRYTDKDAKKQAEKEAKRLEKVYNQAVKNRDKAIKERQKILDKRRKKRAAEVEKQEKEASKQRRKEEAVAAAASVATVENHDSVADSRTELSQSITTTSTVSLSQLPSSNIQSSTLTQETSMSSVTSSPMMSPVREPDQSKAKAKAKAKAKSKSADPIVQLDKPPKPKKERKFSTTPPKVNGQLDPKWVKVFMHDTDEVGAHTTLFFPGPHYEKLVGDVGDMIISWVQDDLTKRVILEDS